MRKPLIEGLIITSRTKWHDDGEKSSKYFLCLEKRNTMLKNITVLKEGEEVYTRTITILQKFTEDISRKYSNVQVMPQNAKKKN